MIMLFDPLTRDRLARIEQSEGTLPEELVREAVAVFAELTRPERRLVSRFAFRLVRRRGRS